MSRKSLLIAQHNTSIRNLLSHSFSQRGYLVYEALDGQEALNLFIKLTPLLVICDEELPGLSGLELLESFKKLQPHVIFILLGLPGNTHHLLQALRLGANQYFLKPLKYIDILDWVDRTPFSGLDRSSQEIAELPLTESHIELEWAGKDISSTSIVEYFAKSLGHYYGIEDIRVLKLGLEEALSNAFEHGNLKISEEEKKAALEAGEYENLFKERIKLYGNKKIHAQMELTAKFLRFTISDQGPGFDWIKRISSNETPIESPQGRGMVLLKALFDDIQYEGCGNRVILTKINPIVPETHTK